MLTDHESQTRPANVTFGALPSPTDVRTYRLKEKEEVAGVAGASLEEKEFPETFELWKPTTKDQGSTYSCVAHALSSVVEYFNHIQEGTNIIFSTAYIYGNRSGSPVYTGKGMHTSVAVHNLMKGGDCPETRFKGNYEVPEAIDKYKEQLSNVLPDAYPHRISSYFSLNGYGPTMTTPLMKEALMEYGPIVISVTWRTGAGLVSEDGFTNVLRLHKETQSEGGHCMYIYGWNQKGWLVGNSWGTRWGNNGSCILPFDEPINERWGIEDKIFTDKTKDAQIQKQRDRIAELEAANLELEKTIATNRTEMMRLSNEVSELSVQLFALQTASTQSEEELKASQEKIEQIQGELKSRLEEIERLSGELTRTIDLVRSKDQEIEDCKKVIEDLNNRILEIEKPFNSKLGDFLAKIFNFFINLFGKKQAE